MTVNVMLDLETWGLTPGSAIRSIGAVAFDPDWATAAGSSESAAKFSSEFYANVDLASCMAAGLRVEASTVDWWDRADEPARAVLRENRLSLGSVLESFVRWYSQTIRGPSHSDRSLPVWAKPLSFDVPLLEAAMRACAIRPPWDHRAGRDVRTLLEAAGLGSDDLPRFDGVPHHALDDARHQARCVLLALSPRQPYQTRPRLRPPEPPSSGASVTLPVYGYLAAAEVAEGTSASPIPGVTQWTCGHGTFPYGECPACQDTVWKVSESLPVVAWVTCDHGTFRIGGCPVCHPIEF